MATGRGLKSRGETPTGRLLSSGKPAGLRYPPKLDYDSPYIKLTLELHEPGLMHSLISHLDYEEEHDVRTEECHPPFRKEDSR
jgi:hypothetical protein